jgi:hypothetical protein
VTRAAAALAALLAPAAAVAGPCPQAVSWEVAVEALPAPPAAPEALEPAPASGPVRIGLTRSTLSATVEVESAVLRSGAAWCAWPVRVVVSYGFARVGTAVAGGLGPCRRAEAEGHERKHVAARGASLGPALDAVRAAASAPVAGTPAWGSSPGEARRAAAMRVAASVSAALGRLRSDVAAADAAIDAAERGRPGGCAGEPFPGG